MTKHTLTRKYPKVAGTKNLKQPKVPEYNIYVNNKAKCASNKISRVDFWIWLASLVELELIYLF